jgi:uncharacterized protein YggE
MRIVAALIVAMVAGAAQAQTRYAQNTYAQTAPGLDSSITVAGEGRINVAPEFAEFFAEVTTRGESLEATTRQHTERAGKAAAALRAMSKHAVSVEHASFRLEQGRPPAGQKQAAREYRAVTTFALKVNRVDSLNDAVSAIAATGMFEVRTVRYGITDEERAIDDARRAAVKNARRQAEVYADAAGVELGEILEIFDGVAQSLGSEASLRAATPNVQVAPPGTIPFRAGINIKWRIVPKPN